MTWSWVGLKPDFWHRCDELAGEMNWPAERAYARVAMIFRNALTARIRFATRKELATWGRVRGPKVDLFLAALQDRKVRFITALADGTFEIHGAAEQLDRIGKQTKKARSRWDRDQGADGAAGDGAEQAAGDAAAEPRHEPEHDSAYAAASTDDDSGICRGTAAALPRDDQDDSRGNAAALLTSHVSRLATHEVSCSSPLSPLTAEGGPRLAPADDAPGDDAAPEASDAPEPGGNEGAGPGPRRSKREARAALLAEATRIADAVIAVAGDPPQAATREDAEAEIEARVPAAGRRVVARKGGWPLFIQLAQAALRRGQVGTVTAQLRDAIADELRGEHDAGPDPPAAA